MLPHPCLLQLRLVWGKWRFQIGEQLLFVSTISSFSKNACFSSFIPSCHATVFLKFPFQTAEGSRSTTGIVAIFTIFSSSLRCRRTYAPALPMQYKGMPGMSIHLHLFLYIYIYLFGLGQLASGGNLAAGSVGGNASVQRALLTCGAVCFTP